MQPNRHRGTATDLLIRKAHQQPLNQGENGPHRDDIRIVFDECDLRRYGSQGQQRLVAVLLRLSELTLIESRLKEPAMLLLDDLFSELDPDVTTRLKTALGKGGRQIFVTSPVPLEWGDGTNKVIKVTGGRIE